MDIFTSLGEWYKICVRILRFLRVEVNHKPIQTDHKNMEGVKNYLNCFDISIWSKNIQNFLFSIVHVNIITARECVWMYIIKVLM